ncbi:MAG: alanine racemase [Tissierellia bacterium]|nr:alanine racemase [Tissierellia bacterium]
MHYLIEGEKLDSLTSLIIDLDAINYNIKQIKDSLPDCTIICPVVKDDCYQMGAKTIVKDMIDNDINFFAVANIDEALEIRALSNNINILVLGHILPSEFDIAIKNNIILTISSLEEAMMINNVAKDIGKKALAHIKIDTGMNRIGFKPKNLGGENFLEVFNFKNIAVEGIFSHFATADENRKFVDFQMKNFKAAMERLPKEYSNIIKHINNSASLLCGYPESFDMVRPGIILYGIDISHIEDLTHLQLKEAFSLKSKLVHIKEVKAGESIGYSQTYKAKKDMLVGTVSIGYGDGYPRRLSNKYHVLINGEYANIVGNICMDQIMIDLTEIKDYKLYDDVVLIGQSKDKFISIIDMANTIDDIPYTIMCGINKRVKRIYIKNNSNYKF